MRLRGCSTSHFIWTVQDGVVKKVHNTDARGKPALKLKKLEDVYQYAGSTPPPFAERPTNGFVAEEVKLEFPSNKDGAEEITLSQLRKKCRRKKRKASESVVLIPKIEDDDPDLNEPLCKLKVKVSKISRSKKRRVNGSSPSSSVKDYAIVTVKVEVPEAEYFECRELTHMGDSLSCNGSVSEPVNHVPACRELILFTNEGKVCGFNEVSYQHLENMDLDDVEIKPNALLLLQGSEMDEEDDVNQSSITLISLEENCSLEDLTATASDFECRELTHMGEDSLSCNGSGFLSVNLELESNESRSFRNEGELCSLDDVSHQNSEMDLDDEEFMPSSSMPSQISEVDEEECVQQSQPIVSSPSYSSSFEDLTASMSDCSQGQLYLQHAPEQVYYICDVQASEITVDDDNCYLDPGQSSDLSVGDPRNQEYDSPSLMPDYLCLPWKSSSLRCPDDHVDDAVSVEVRTVDENCCLDPGQSSDLYVGDPRNQEYDFPSLMPDYMCLPWKSSSFLCPNDHADDVESVEVKSPIAEEKQNLTPVHTDAELNSLNSDIYSFDSDDMSVRQKHSPLVPVDVDSGVKLSDHKDGIMSEASEVRNPHLAETRHPERLHSARKAISPNSQEKLCTAMKSGDILDDIDQYKCNEKLNFGDQAENKFSTTISDVDNELNLHPQQGRQRIQNKVVISSKDLLKRLRSNKKGSPPKSLPPKNCLDGPRQCRSLPRFSTGCTSIEGCSESAIAFSQRQMRDIETLASKLMSELNSMKNIVQDKLLYEAYRSTSLKNEADEVASAIKSATKTEEAAKKWLSMMARDCNRFCKIMKLNEDTETSASNSTLGSTNQQKPLQKERKKISFADEAGGTLCDIKVYQTDRVILE
uniref:uncharacterized protein LOC122608406 n=1 Tax=Erigeron canadensis TaxID=72917 RepID=UPI001CB9C1D2|nr:uncharacterized protein LOC122608406 [Erigeron canadensis]